MAHGLRSTVSGFAEIFWPCHQRLQSWTLNFNSQLLILNVVLAPLTQHCWLWRRTHGQDFCLPWLFWKGRFDQNPWNLNSYYSGHIFLRSIAKAVNVPVKTLASTPSRIPQLWWNGLTAHEWQWFSIHCLVNLTRSEWLPWVHFLNPTWFLYWLIWSLDGKPGKKHLIQFHWYYAL